ncbi:MAG: TlpA family protein disulfide reductase [Planctomycetaceae bacterium]|nr:TlpA family protein disulfide reductase [Planctomycetaceae bacterium]
MHTILSRIVFTLLIAPVLLIAACNSAGTDKATAAAPSSAVKLEIKTLDEIEAAIKAHAGKVVVVDTWSTQCEPCMKEFPGLVALHAKHGDKVACISVSCDYEGLGTPEKVVPPVLEFLQQQKATFQNFLSKDDSDKVFARFKIPSIPAVFIYGKDGQLAEKIARDFSYEKDVNPVVEKLLK